LTSDGKRIIKDRFDVEQKFTEKAHTPRPMKEKHDKKELKDEIDDYYTTDHITD
jgi:hypothetical protein